MSDVDPPMKPSQPREVTPSVPRGMEVIVRAGVKAGRQVTGSVALGGTVCAMYAQHRLSIDVDFVVKDLIERFDQIREQLLDLPGWSENRVRRPVLILGSLDGVEIGYRQLRRKTPIETTQVATPDGALVIPTLGELVRIKAFLAYDRNCARDFIDFAELASLLGEEATVAALSVLDEKIGWEKQPLVLDEVIKALLVSKPRDLETDGYATFRWLNPRLKSWAEVASLCKTTGRRLSVRKIIEEQAP